jgi:DNA-binding response OmpR family regulator/S1-C subfamily serine protease
MGAAMSPGPERIVIIEADPGLRQSLSEALRQAGYDALVLESVTTGLEALHRDRVDLLILGANLPDTNYREVISNLKGSVTTQDTRIILLGGASTERRAEMLDLGADDVVSTPVELAELLARIRARLRAKRELDVLREKTSIAEQGQQIAHTAFEALAVTEKMSQDASTLGRGLRIGLAAVFVVAAVMAVIFFGFFHTAKKAIGNANAVIAKLEGGLMNQQDLMAQARKLRQQSDAAKSGEASQALQQKAAALKAQMAGADAAQVRDLQRELTETNARLKRIEESNRAAQNIIPMDVSSVCLLHVAVGFRDKDSGQRLRYAGINPQGEPLQDSSGQPILTTEGRGPEVRVDVFGTGFLAGPDGTAVTNRHVAEPWWKDDEMASLVSAGLQPEIASIHAYFPDDSQALTAEISQISPETDLATLRISLDEVKRSLLRIDGAKEAAVSGEPIVLMGYATGLAAILARTDEDTAQQIISSNNGDVSAILDNLAKRKLIRPLITQGHIGDVLPDKIVFDAQTTSGGSGGPLLNHDGEVIGVTYAVLKGFGGSNFGIPVRFVQPLLAQKPPAGQ